MLVLTRKPNQSIIIGKNVFSIKVVSIRGNQVKLGIEAPREFSVHRQEIYNQIMHQQGDEPACVGDSIGNTVTDTAQPLSAESRA